MQTQLLEALDRLLEAAVRLQRERLVAPYVKKAERAIGTAFVKQGREFTRRFTKVRDSFAEAALVEKTAETPEWGPLFTAAEVATASAFELPLNALMKAALASGARSAIAEFKIEASFSLQHPAAVAFLKDRAAERVTMINETTRSGLKTLLAKAMDEGWSYDKTAKAIGEQFEGFAGRLPQQHIRSRAHLVAVQEAGEAYEEGHLQMVKGLTDVGLEMEKAWSTVGDNRVSDQCMSDEGAGWIPIDDQFPSGNDRPPGHVSCRCTALYRRKPTAKEA